MLFDTTSVQVSEDCLKGAKEGIERLRRILDEMDGAFAVHTKGRAFPVHYCERIVVEAFTVCNEVARANGAVLVRSTA